MTAFYKFPDKETFESLDKQEVPVDILGGISVQDEEGNSVEIQGYHVNALSEVQEWKEYKVQVNSPVRIFG